MSAVAEHIVFERWRGDEIRLQCPRCRRDLPANGCARFICGNCAFEIESDRGIWKCLLPERMKYFEQFMREYEVVRSNEGRGSTDPQYYLTLPFNHSSRNNAAQWEIRAKTYRYIETTFLRPHRGRLNVLDLGAGNCWLSYRMALGGHRPVAVDLLTNDSDGLGSAKFYASVLPDLFPRFQAELDRLPFADDQFDWAIFNASFHYSENYERTLAEAIRCTRQGGSIIIADTAWYSRDDSGRKMLAERKQMFRSKYGFTSDSVPALEYLTDERLNLLEERFGIRWEVHRPFYGVKWHLRPLVARLRGRREPSRFRVYVAEVRK